MNQQIKNKLWNKCRKETAHRVTYISRIKGIKLKCLICGYQSARYSNPQKLKPIELKGGLKE